MTLGEKNTELQPFHEISKFFSGIAVVRRARLKTHLLIKAICGLHSRRCCVKKDSLDSRCGSTIENSLGQGSA